MSSLPIELQEQLHVLEQWAIENREEARSDARLFWRLKIPAIVISSSAGLIAYLDSPLASQIVGTLAGVLVAIDGIRPRGLLRDAHHRAYSDLRNLEGSMVAKWRARPMHEDDIAAARRIIGEAEPERLRIANYLRDAEAPNSQ